MIDHDLEEEDDEEAEEEETEQNESNGKWQRVFPIVTNFYCSSQSENGAFFFYMYFVSIPVFFSLVVPDPILNR